MKTKDFKILIGIFVCLLCSVTSVYGRVRTVGASGTGSAYTSLVDAVNAAQTGDTLMLLSNVTLDENLSFSKSVVVMSRNGYAIKRKSVSIIWDLIHLYNTSIYINGGIEVVFSNIVLDSDNLSSSSGFITYNHFVSVNSGAVLRLNRTVIRNSTEGAPLAVSGTVFGGLVTGNTSSDSEVGVVLVNSEGLLVNMVIASNVLNRSNVSAVNLNGGNMLNCTVINNNSSSGSSPNRYAVNSSNNGCKITNCIIYGNGGAILNRASVTYSCVQGGYAGAGNISANPLLNSDYTLRDGSPCVDAGSNRAISGVTDSDYFGKARINGLAVDMGATEKPRSYCERTDSHLSCGEPFVWIDGKTYTESNHTALDTILGYGDCDTIVSLDLTYYPPVDKSSLSDGDVNKIDCSGEEVTFSFDPSASGRTSFQWLNPSGGVVGTSSSYTATVGTHDVEYLFVASAPSGACPDTTIFRALLNYDFFVQNLANASVDSAPNNGCLLKNLDLSYYKPTISYCSSMGRDTSYLYRLNNGSWVDFETAPILSDVASGDEIRWHVTVRTYDGDVLEDETPDPIVVHLWDDQKPELICDDISKGKRTFAVADSIGGVVPCSVSLQDVLSAASDNCTSDLKVSASLDGTNFIDFNGFDGTLNVFDNPSITAYWRVEDLSGLQSSVCAVSYEVERATLLNGEYYAIVRDTLVCSFPVSWHGHTFTSDGEQAKVGAALLTVRMDSSYYKTETIVNAGPYTWRDGKTYTESTEVNDFHQPNAGACDSVFSLRLTIKEPSNLKIDEPISPVDSAMNEGCLLSRLDLETLKPGFVYNADNALDTTVFYRVNGGGWVNYAGNSILTQVENGTRLYWRVDITADDQSIVTDETVNPQVIRVNDVAAPILDCDRISAGNLFAPVRDSVMGEVSFRVDPDDVRSVASDNCSSNLAVFVSKDGLPFSEYTGGSFPLNVFSQPSATLYWKVRDGAGNESSACPIEYAVERNTEVGAKKYAIVRDTILCAGDFPFVWHGHTFTYVGEEAEVGAALLSVHVDSSFFVEENVMTMEPYTWRDGVTYTESVRVDGFHKPNAEGCDSVFALNLVMKANHSLVIYEAASPIDSAANDGCRLRRLDMPTIRPAFVYSSNDAIDTIVYYRVNGGGWVNLADQPTLLDVADGMELRWKVEINTQDTSLSDETVNPQVIRVKNLTAPDLACDGISAGKRFIAVTDSVNGAVRFSVSPSDVKSAASSECASSFDVLYSNDGVNFNPYNGLTFNLDVFTQTDRTLYWKVKDESGKLSDACAVDYSVERATERNGKMYAIVRDTFVCANSFPVTWHGHVFNAAGESAEIGAALLSARIDSSYYRYDTLIVCNSSSYLWRDGKSYSSGSSYDLSYTVDNGPDRCDSVVFVHLSVFAKVNKRIADTIYSEGCYGDPFRMGYTQSGQHTEYAWYEQGVLQHGEDWDGKTRVTMYYSGHDNYQYMLITTAKGGYCPDTTVYVTNSTHDIESDEVKSLVMFAGDSCKARVRIRDYMPGFIDRCSYDYADTLCAYRINHGIVQYASADDYYDFVDGDSISWRVGIVANDGLTYTVSNPDFYQQVRVLDATAPRVDSFGISYGNRIQPVTDSIGGDVFFRVPLSDVTDHVSDNCDAVTDLLYQYSLDGVTYEDFSGIAFKLNVYDSPSLKVYYAVTDFSSNTLIDSVLYTVERKSFVGEDSFAIVNDTMVCPGDMPFVWHGRSFATSGTPVVVGAAHLTVYTDESYERYDTVFSCGSYVWRDGVEYSSSTTEPVFVVHNGEGVCDSVIHLNLTVLNPSSGVDSIVVCVRELPYEWHGSQVSGDTTLNLRNVMGCDSLVDVKVVVLPIATETIYDTACGSYRLNDTVYTESGVYEQMLTSTVTGCDSILTLHLVVNHPTYASLSDTACGSYTVNDSVYTQSGVYEQKLLSSTGCDSILTLNLTILETSYGADTLVVCEGMLPVRWKGRSVMGDTVIRFQNAVGCDSLVSLKVIANPVPVVEITDTACGTYTLNEYEYNKSGDYVQLLTTEGNCDSIVKLHLTILEPSSQTLYDTVCGPYTINGQTYTETGVYEQRLTAANGCDSVLFLVLDIIPAGDTLITEISSVAYQLNDSIYTQSGIYTQHIPTSNGCDSIVRLDLTIVEGIVSEWSDTTCSGGIFWDNSLISQSGTYIKHYVTETGADSTSILHLTVLPPVQTHIVDTAYSYYVLNDSVYTKSGIYTQHLYTKERSCDSILTLTLKILNFENGTVRDTACDSFVLNDSVYTESGTYEQHFLTPDGRDSTLILELSIYPSYEVQLADTACGSYQLNDSTYTKSGLYEQRLQSVTGCDSVIKLDLTVWEVPTRVITDTVCGSYVLNDTVYRKSGSYEQLVPSPNGCDSLIKLNLTVLPSPVTLVFDTVCISYRLNDSVYTETGIYEQRFTAENGCDSIVRLNLIVLSSPSNVVYDTACVSYTVEGSVYTESTVLEKKVDSPIGCDSIITVHLTILPIMRDTIYRSACGTYTLNDSVYTESGVYDQTLVSSLGCDSILTLYLTILEPTYGEDTVDICENASSVKWHGFDVSSDTSLTIQNSLGCDSIVAVHLNRLSVLRSEFEDTSCAPYVWHDKEYMKSGDYDYKLVSSYGCDSIITLHLTILPSYEIFLLDSAVSSYEWNGERYDSSGMYTQRLVSAQGCDSVVTMMLTILPPPEKTPEKVNACISYEWQGMTLTESGVYYDLLKTAAGEDSIVSIDLTINYPKYSKDTIHYTVCENELPVIWNDYEIYSDTSRVVLTTREGCDSFVIFRLNILPIYDTTVSVTTCDSFEWHGRYLYESGLYTDTLQSLLGCDSITRLSLTVKSSSVTKIRRTLCESELPVRWNEYEFYGDTLIVFPSANGCDSIIDVKLIVNKEYDLVFNEVACGDFHWQGRQLTKSGTYVDSFTTAAGCDSVVTLNLIVSHPYSVRLVDTTKAGTVYEKNGFTVEADHIGNFEYEVNLLSQYGCDSVVHLSLYVDGRDIKIRWTSVSGGASVYYGEKNMKSKFCAGDEFHLNYEILNGVPDTFKFFFDSEGIAQGFRNVVGAVKEGETGSITFTVPEGIAPGTYNVNAQMFGEGKYSKVETVPIRIGYDARYVMRMWNDVVVCDNSRNEFVAYQWRKNNVDIPGATGQYYCEMTGLDGYYSLHAITADNDTMYVCGKYFEALNVPFTISTYPTFSNRGKVTVYVHGVDEADLEGARMYIYTLEGQLKYWTDIVHKENEVWVTEGRCVCIVILADDRSATCKFMSKAAELIK